MVPQRDHLLCALTAAVAMLAGASCGAITEGGARDTLAPLPAPAQGVSITQVTLPVPQSPSTTVAAAVGSVATDDADPVSVAIRFLDAAAAGNEAAGSTLEVGDAQPRAFDWAVATYESTLDVAGAEAWGRPQCSPAARGTVTCTWLANDPTTSLVLVDDGGEWRVSHPLLAPPGDPPEVSSACVAGDDPVRVRAGPGTDWPYFQVLQPRTCDVTMLDNVTDGPSGPWRYVTIGGTPGWIVDRVLRPS